MTRPYLLFVTITTLFSLVNVTSASHEVHRRHGQVGHHLLNHLNKRKDFYHGVAIRAEQVARIGEDSLHCIMPNMNMGVPEWEMKWFPIEANGPGQFDWDRTDKIAAWLYKNKKAFRGHCGVWKEATPGWVNALDGKDNQKKLATALYNHIYAVVHRYGKQMVSFDVVNEPFDYEHPSEFRDTVFWRNLGHEMYRIAYRAADDARRHIGSNVKLYLNEFNIEGDTEANVKKRNALLELIDWMQEQKIPLDGIGLQGHFKVDNFPKNLAKVVKQFTDKGVEVGFTEVDIRIRNDDNSQETKYEQARQYAAIYETCLSNPKCKMVIRWNFDDDHSWIPITFSGYGRATIFGSQCRPKSLILNEITKVLDRY